MAWNYVITDSLGALTQQQKEENAVAFYTHFATSMTLEAICGLLGNIDVESQLNPGQQENGYGGSTSRGYGLIQWTPATLLLNWATLNNYNWYDGEAQSEYIDEENYYTGSDVVWIPTTAYPYTWNQYKALTDVEIATKAYLYERERAGASAESSRIQAALSWYNYLSSYQPIQYVPRLTSDGMLNNPWWYSNGNPFYASGYGLPNCTCYAYGRYAEVRNAFANLPTGDAGTWYDNATAFERGQTPKLGSVICFKSRSGTYLGHVAIVEVINQDGSIVTSNSGWQASYFWTETLYPSLGYCSNWMTHGRDYYCQGFIYNDIITPVPPTPTPTQRTKLPLWLLLRYY